jgi:hypothetical protein
MIHHDFEFTPAEFEARKARPERLPIDATVDWTGEYASQSPLNAMTIETHGGGAAGTKSYLALHGNNSAQFYCEATPWWYRPRQVLDLRNTRATLYLKAITPITVNPGYQPYLFIDDYCEVARSYCGWYLNQLLQVGNDWVRNDLILPNDPALWTRYSEARSLDTVLSRVGFIGVAYARRHTATGSGVGATGVLGLDEFTYDVPL